MENKEFIPAKKGKALLKPRKKIKEPEIIYLGQKNAISKQATSKVDVQSKTGNG